MTKKKAGPAPGRKPEKGIPFDDIRALAEKLPPADEKAAAATRERHRVLEERFGASPDSANSCMWLSRWSGKVPGAARPTLAIFAGTHYVDARVDYPSGESETQARVDAIADGRSPVHGVCGPLGIGLKVFDLALGYPAGDIVEKDALDEKACAATIGFGMEAIAGGVDLLGLAATGRGDLVANTAILVILCGGTAADWIMPGGDIRLNALVTLADKAAQRAAGWRDDPLRLLRALGGREHAAIAGAILAARMGHVPVILDGMTALTVALLIERLRPGSCSHCRSAGGEQKGRIARIRQMAGLPALGGFGGEMTDGTQAAMAFGLIARHVDIHNTPVEARQTIVTQAAS